MNPKQLFKRYRELQAYVSWTEDDAACVREAAKVLEPCLPALIDDFYAAIERHPGASNVLTGGKKQVQHLKGALLGWLKELLSGPYDRDYVERRWRVGRRHLQIGLDQVYANAAMSRLRTGINSWLHEYWSGTPQRLGQTSVAMNRLLDLDLAIIEDAYQAEQAEEVLRSQRDFIEAVLNTVGALVVVLDHEGRIVRFNRTCEQTTGYEFDEVAGKCFWDVLVTEDEAEPARAVCNELRFGHFPSVYENHWVGRDGSKHLIAWSNTCLLDDEGKVEHVIGTGIDITEKREAENSLRQSTEKLQAILNTAADGIITIDEQGRIENVNPAVVRMFGYEADEMIGKNVAMLMPDPHAASHGQYLGSYLDTGTRKIIGYGREVVGMRKDGSIFPMDLAVSEVRDERTRLFTGIVRDITERKRLEREVLTISESEHDRIGQDLHDDLGQQLTGIAFLSQVLANQLKSQELPEGEEAERISQLVNTAIDHTRRLVRGLSPIDLDEITLRQAVERFADDLKNVFGITCEVQWAGGVTVPRRDTATHLYRIIQEAAHNAVRHGKATKLAIHAKRDNGQVTLKVEDNGVGMPTQIKPTRGAGLRNMRHRARIIGASFDIDPGEDGGTVVTCKLSNFPIESDLE